jgi:predicted nicotinamide N-methyase
MNPPRRLPETPASALGPTVRDTIVVAGQTLVVCRPDAVDRLIDDPDLGAASAVDEYMPYWASIWPAAHVLAEAVVHEPWPHMQTSEKPHAVEIGCGLGLPGLAALTCGFRVTFSDYDATSLRFVSESARGNGFADFDVLQMDWRWPPSGLQVPLVLAADVAYDRELFAPLAALLRGLLAPDGLCLMANGDRVQVPALGEALLERGLDYAIERVVPVESGGRVHLWRIRHAGG